MKATHKKRWRVLGRPGAVLGMIALVVALGSCTSRQSHWKEENIPTRRFAPPTADQVVTGESEREANAILTVLEFGDDGELLVSGQKERILEKIRNTPDLAKIYIYAHGWHNSADPDRQSVKAEALEKKGDLIKFDDLLHRMAKAENRPILGVYVGWRGDNLSLWGVNMFTLDNRRAIARRIGGSPPLNSAISEIAKAGHEKGVTVVAVGHSLGAVMMENAALYDAQHESQKGSSPDIYLLLNSAEEAEVSKKAIKAINTRALRLEQMPQNATRIHNPKVIALTSATDDANSRWNPVNSFISFRGARKALGFEPDLQTHFVEETTWRRSSTGLADAIKLNRSSELDSTFWVPTNESGKMIQVRLQVPKTKRAASKERAEGGFWNILIPEALVRNHGDIGNGNALASYAAFIGRSQEWIGVRERILDMRNNVESRRFTDGTGQGDPLSIQGRDLFEGLAYRIPRNPETVKLILDEIDSLDPESLSLSPQAGQRNWKLQYMYRLFSILKFSNTLELGWNQNNIRYFRQIRAKNPEVINYAIKVADSTDKGPPGPILKKFIDLVDQFDAPKS